MQFIEQSGARVVPVKYDLPSVNLTKVFQNLNGIFIPGGSYPLNNKEENQKESKT